MVVEYALDSRKPEAANLSEIERLVGWYSLSARKLTSGNPFQVKEGDLTIIMKDFEQGLRSPMRNVLAGRLVRTILIQVCLT